MPDENVAMQWNIYEHEHVERGSDWFWALGIIAICGALISLLFHDILFGLVILAAAFTFALTARSAPELVAIELSDKGIRINGILHHFEDIISFWVEDEYFSDRPLLLVDTKKWLAPNLIIPIEHVEPTLIRAYLKERVKETQMHEPVAHKILGIFGF